MRRRLNGKEGRAFGFRNQEYRDGNATGRSDTRPYFRKKKKLFPMPTND